MKKRILAALLSMACIVALCSCGSTSSTPAATESTPNTSAPAPAPPAAADNQTYDFTWGACSASSGYYALNVAVADLIKKNLPNVNVTVMETGGGSQNLQFLMEGQVQFGQTSVPDIYLAANAMGSFEGAPKNEQVRLMISLLPNVYYFAVRADSKIDSIADLNGKTFSPGGLSSATERLTYYILEELGVEPKWYYASTGEAVDAIKNRRIDGFVKSGSSTSMDSSIADAKTSVDIKILSFTEEEMKRIKDAFPFYSFQEVDGSVYGQEGTISSITSYYSYGVSKDVPEEVVYNIVKAICGNQSYLEGSYAGLAGWDPAEITATNTSGYMHPGLIKYLKEQGYTISDAQIPPEAK